MIGTKLFSVFKKYYLSLFLIFISLGIIYCFFNDISFEKLLGSKIFLIITLLGPIVFGSIDLISDKFYKPWRIKQRLKQSPIKEFIDIGFELKDESYSVGKIEGYTVLIECIWYEYSRNSTLRYQVLFNPKNDHHRFLFQQEYENLERKLKKSKRYLTMNSIVKDYHWDLFLNPNYTEIYKDICFTVEFMKQNALKPITYDDTKNMSSEIDSHARAIKNFIY